MRALTQAQARTVDAQTQRVDGGAGGRSGAKSATAKGSSRPGRRQEHRQGRRSSQGAKSGAPAAEATERFAAGGQGRHAVERQATQSTEWSERWTKA